MYAGDEDNGSFGAWFIFNAIGFYPLSPASGDFTFGSPLFQKVTIKVDGAILPLVITAVNQGPNNVYVRKVTMDGKLLKGTSISNAVLVKGGHLEFTMSSTSKTTETSTERPFQGVDVGVLVGSIAGILVFFLAFGVCMRRFLTRTEEDMNSLLKCPKSQRKKEEEQEETETLTKL